MTPAAQAAGRGKEGDLVRACLQLLTARGWLAWRNQSGMIRGSHKGKPWAVRMGLVGMPDVLALHPESADCARCWKRPWCGGCVPPLAHRHGQFLAVECKRPGNKPTATQLAMHRAIEAAGGRVLVVYGIDELAEALR